MAQDHFGPPASTPAGPARWLTLVAAARREVVAFYREVSQNTAAGGNHAAALGQLLELLAQELAGEAIGADPAGSVPTLAEPLSYAHAALLSAEGYGLPPTNSQAALRAASAAALVSIADDLEQLTQLLAGMVPIPGDVLRELVAALDHAGAAAGVIDMGDYRATHGATDAGGPHAGDGVDRG